MTGEMHSTTLESPSHVLRLAFSWLWVGIPLALGVYATVLTSLLLFWPYTFRTETYPNDVSFHAAYSASKHDVVFAFFSRGLQVVEEGSPKQDSGEPDILWDPKLPRKLVIKGNEYLPPADVKAVVVRSDGTVTPLDAKGVKDTKPPVTQEIYDSTVLPALGDSAPK